MNKKIAITALAAALGLGTGGAAQSATIAQILAANPAFLLQSNSFFSADQINVDAGGDKILDVGDTLRGIADFSFINGVSLGGANSSLSAVFEAEVLTKGTSGDEGAGEFDFTFGPHANFDNGPDGINGTIDDLPTGTMIAFYEDAVDNATISPPGCTTPGQGGDCEAKVTDGTLVLALGFSALEQDEAWEALNSREDTTALVDELNSVTFENFNLQLDVLFSSVGTFLPTQPTPIAVGGGDGLIAWTGSAKVLGIENPPTTDITPYTRTLDTDFAAEIVPPQTPEPATLALMGIGLLGLGARRRRKA